MYSIRREVRNLFRHSVGGVLVMVRILGVFGLILLLGGLWVGGLCPGVLTAQAASGDIGSVQDTLEFDGTLGYDPCVANVAKVLGDMESAVEDSLTYDTNVGVYGCPFQVGDGYYASAVGGTDSDGYVKSYTVDSSGQIGAAVTDFLEFDTSSCLRPSVARYGSSDIYAIFYTGVDSDGWVATVDIDSTGNIEAAIEDSHEFDGSAGYYSEAVYVSGDVFAVAYRGDSNSGMLQTLDVNSDGSIDGSPKLDDWTFNSQSTVVYNLIHVDGTVYLISFYDDESKFTSVITVNIASNGTITESAIDSVSIWDGSGNDAYCDVVGLGGGVYVAAYVDPDASPNGKLCSFTVTNSGDISTIVDTETFGTSMAHPPAVVPLSDEGATVFWEDTSDNLYCSSLPVDGSGNISAEIEQITVSSDATWPDAIRVAEDVFLVDYFKDSGSDGVVATMHVLEDSGPSEYFVTAYRDSGEDGKMCTYTIADDGTVSNAVVDTLVFENGFKVECCEVLGYPGTSVYSVWYYDDSSWDGFVSTVVISALDGSIGASREDYHEYDTVQGMRPDALYISGDVFLVGYQGTGNDLYLKTLDINSDGSIDGSPELDSFEIDDITTATAKLVHVSGTMYACLYQSDGNDVNVLTITVSAAGDIGAAVTDDVELVTDTSGSMNASGAIEKGLSTYYAVAYTDSDDDGQLGSLSISDAGDIAVSFTDTEEFDTTNGEMVDAIHLGQGWMVVGYKGSGDDATVCSYNMSSSGVWSSKQDSLVIDSGTVYSDVVLLEVDDGVTVAVYTDGDYDGWAKTFDVEYNLISLSNSPSSYDFGLVSTSGTSASGLTNFTVENTGDTTCDITIQATDFSGGGETWTLSDTATPGAGTCGLKAGLETDYTIVVRKTSTFNTLVSSLAVDATDEWGLKLWAPTSGILGNQVTSTVTLTATEDMG